MDGLRGAVGVVHGEGLAGLIAVDPCAQYLELRIDAGGQGDGLPCGIDDVRDIRRAEVELRRTDRNVFASAEIVEEVG